MAATTDGCRGHFRMSRACNRALLVMTPYVRKTASARIGLRVGGISVVVGRLLWGIAAGVAVFVVTAAGPTPGVTVDGYALPNEGSVPGDITAGPDGALWFTESIVTGSAVSDDRRPSPSTRFRARTAPQAGSRPARTARSGSPSATVRLKRARRPYQHSRRDQRIPASERGSAEGISPPASTARSGSPRCDGSEIGRIDTAGRSASTRFPMRVAAPKGSRRARTARSGSRRAAATGSAVSARSARSASTRFPARSARQLESRPGATARCGSPTLAPTGSAVSVQPERSAGTRFPARTVPQGRLRPARTVRSGSQKAVTVSAGSARPARSASTRFQDAWAGLPAAGTARSG